MPFSSYFAMPDLNFTMPDLGVSEAANSLAKASQGILLSAVNKATMAHAEFAKLQEATLATTVCVNKHALATQLLGDCTREAFHQAYKSSEAQIEEGEGSMRDAQDEQPTAAIPPPAPTQTDVGPAVGPVVDPVGAQDDSGMEYPSTATVIIGGVVASALVMAAYKAAPAVYGFFVGNPKSEPTPVVPPATPPTTPSADADDAKAAAPKKERSRSTHKKRPAKKPQEQAAAPVKKAPAAPRRRSPRSRSTGRR